MGIALNWAMHFSIKLNLKYEGLYFTTNKQTNLLLRSRMCFGAIASRCQEYLFTSGAPSALKLVKQTKYAMLFSNEVLCYC